MNTSFKNTDSLLVKELRKGSWDAFSKLFDKYGSKLYCFAYGYLRSKEESEELVQEVFSKIWEKRSDLQDQKSFKSYLFTIAFNLIKKHFRRRTQIEAFFNSERVSNFDMQTSESVDFNSLESYLNKFIDKLPERRREILVKSRFEGDSLKEIADKMKISKKTVENQLTIALKFVREHLEKQDLRY